MYSAVSGGPTRASTCDRNPIGRHNAFKSLHLMGAGPRMPAPLTTTIKCRLCGDPGAVEFLNIGRQSLANKYPTDADYSNK